jgi:polyisoprenyl-phosphate glycosyltransferase
MRSITVVTGCFNEEGNVRPLYETVKEIFRKLPAYHYEHLFIDNASTDRTVEVLREIAAVDPNVKVIVNTRNFGHIRSPFHGLLQSQGDATIMLAADFQDPPELMPEMVRKWEEGHKIVVGIKERSHENPLMFLVRRFYYWTVEQLAEIKMINNMTGFGIYDRVVVDAFREIDDPYPYMRGLVPYVGYEWVGIPYTQPRRRSGVSKNNLYTLYDMAMLGVTNHSKIPLRLAAMLGFLLSGIFLLIALGYLVAKLLFWNEFSLGLAPLVIGLFLFASVQLFFIGIIGEYIGAIHTQVQRRPRVLEKERINF